MSLDVHESRVDESSKVPGQAELCFHDCRAIRLGDGKTEHALGSQPPCRYHTSYYGTM